MWTIASRKVRPRYSNSARCRAGAAFGSGRGPPGYAQINLFGSSVSAMSILVLLFCGERERAPCPSLSLFHYRRPKHVAFPASGDNE